MEYQKTVEAAGDLIGNEVANKITKVWRSSPQNNSETMNMIKKYLKKIKISCRKAEKYWWSGINTVLRKWNIKK